MRRTSRSGSSRCRSIGEQAVRQVGAFHLDAVGQNERARELAGGDAAVEILAAACHRPAACRASVSCLSSSVISSWSRVKPATASVIRRQLRAIRRPWRRVLCCRADTRRLAPLDRRGRLIARSPQNPGASGFESMVMRDMAGPSNKRPLRSAGALRPSLHPARPNAARASECGRPRIWGPAGAIQAVAGAPDRRKGLP
jgi:hypothetical protein